MTKAYQVMTHSLVSVSPDASVADVAEIMRDRDIGNVLVMDKGKLKGIVTDRDLATRALAESGDLQLTPIKKFLTKRVVTGQPHWDLKKVAGIMGKNQIRRLPIVRNDQVIGMISLGDVATYLPKKQVGESLADISESSTGRVAKRMGRGALMGLVFSGVALAGWMLLTRYGGQSHNSTYTA